MVVPTKIFLKLPNSSADSETSAALTSVSSSFLIAEESIQMGIMEFTEIPGVVGRSSTTSSGFFGVFILVLIIICILLLLFVIFLLLRHLSRDWKSENRKKNSSLPINSDYVPHPRRVYEIQAEEGCLYDFYPGRPCGPINLRTAIASLRQETSQLNSTNSSRSSTKYVETGCLKKLHPENGPFNNVKRNPYSGRKKMELLISKKTIVRTESA
ncbi:hypothetical protein AB6A40_003525 [Gnathostoma spinigerum]|uniref:Uncharacterized protein n=1 Tax=Gnathostoma spinigerum TaxID=75299 RepID=A0ABD6EC98_9BILA